nr:hypothetical protein [Tanacetum cinerariifolium]
MANFPNSSSEEIVRESVPRVEKDRLLVLLNQEINEDFTRGLGDSEDAVETVMFMERMQFDDIEKCTRSLSTMKETEVKICKKVMFILKLRASVAASPAAIPCDSWLVAPRMLWCAASLRTVAYAASAEGNDSDRRISLLIDSYFRSRAFKN